MTVTYRIPDEPAGARERGWIVDPFWPLLGVMLAGAWLGAALFALNAWELRGPTWRREIGLSVAMLAGAAVLGFVIGQAETASLVPAGAVKYTILLIIAWKLGLTYWIYYLQQTAFSLYEYFGGKALNGLPIILVGGFFVDRLVINALDHPLWKAMVS